jgi:hypothetical protein
MPRLRLFVFAAILTAGAWTGADAQWLNYPTPGTPRTPDGKPNLTATAPRAADGKADLSGVWLHQPTPIAEMTRLFGDRGRGATLTVPGEEPGTISKYIANILVDFKPEDVPMRPEAAEILHRRAGTTNAPGNCLPLGIPIAGLLFAPIKIVQSPRLIVIMYEQDNTLRQIYTDGRGLPKEVVQSSWLGYSVGKWERGTLVVETSGFNDKTWLDAIGHPHSEALRIAERFRRRDFGHMDVEMTFDDPEMYTKPFTIRFTQDLLADSDIFEYICNENEKDRAHVAQK